MRLVGHRNVRKGGPPKDTERDEAVYETVTGADGATYSIPVDSEGHVPLWAICERFQSEGTVEDIDRDLETTGEVRLPTKCTPQELVDSGWWQDPHNLDVDIEGVDTADSRVYSSGNAPKAYRKPLKRISILAPDDEAERIRGYLVKYFDPEELEYMSKNGSVIIREIPDCGGATGVYFRKQDGVTVPYMVIEPGLSADPVVHELVHHRRASDPHGAGITRTAFPTDRRTGRMLSSWHRLPKEERDRISAEEEKATTLETLARTGRDPGRSGYYDKIPGIDGDEAYEEDLRTLSRSVRRRKKDDVPELKGRAAEVAVTQNYEYTNVARALIMSHDVKKRGRKRAMALNASRAGVSAKRGRRDEQRHRQTERRGGSLEEDDGGGEGARAGARQVPPGDQARERGDGEVQDGLRPRRQGRGQEGRPPVRGRQGVPVRDGFRREGRGDESLRVGRRLPEAQEGAG